MIDNSVPLRIEALSLGQTPIENPLKECHHLSETAQARERELETASHGNALGAGLWPQATNEHSPPELGLNSKDKGECSLLYLGP